MQQIMSVVAIAKCFRQNVYMYICNFREILITNETFINDYENMPMKYIEFSEVVKIEKKYVEKF